MKKHEKDRQVDTLFLSIENNSFTCMGVQFWVENELPCRLNVVFHKHNRKMVPKENELVPERFRPPMENDKGSLKPSTRLPEMSPKCIQECKKTLLVFFAVKKIRCSIRFFCLVFLCFHAMFDIPRGVMFSTFAAENLFFCE